MRLLRSVYMLASWRWRCRGRPSCQPAASCGLVGEGVRRPCRVELARVMSDEPVRGVWAPEGWASSGAQTPRTGSSRITRVSATLHGLRPRTHTWPQLAAGWQHDMATLGYGLP